jgi:large subunit ribosomal protein L15
MKRLLSILPNQSNRALLKFQNFKFATSGAQSKLNKPQKVPHPVNYKFEFNTLKNPLDQYVNLKENVLCDNKGSRKQGKRLGRGRASHHGKTSGHGHLGQGQRLTKKKWGFEGGQTPIMRRLPKFGRSKLNQKRLDYININRLVYFLERQWLTSSADNFITIKSLVDSGAVSKVKHGLKLLSKGVGALKRLPYPIFIEVNYISKPAFEAIKNAGGMVRIRYMTKLKLKEHIYPNYFRISLDEPLPAKDAIVKMEDYRNWGCEVAYRIPKWVKEDMENGGEYFKPKEKASLKELVESTKKRVKPILPRQYNFSF